MEKLKPIRSVNSTLLSVTLEFGDSLENADFSNIKNQENPDNCLKNLYNLLIDKFSKTTKHSEWYDLESRRLMLKKDRCIKNMQLTKYLLRPDQISKNQYHNIRNIKKS